MKWAALLGNPIGHTFSPLIHNMAFSQAGIDGVYIPIQVNTSYLSEVLTGLCFVENLLGFNLTIPFKERALREMDKLSEEAMEIGAVNTVKRGEDKLIGYNTDWIGFLKALEEEFKDEVRGKMGLIVGAGGAARAVAYALMREGIKEIWIAGRDQFKLEKLVKDLSPDVLRPIKLNDPELIHLLPQIDIIVNATPLGLRGEKVPLTLQEVKRDTFIMDLIYNPPETPLLKETKERGIKCCNGILMLIHQALEAFYIWTGVRPQLSPIRDALLKELSK